MRLTPDDSINRFVLAGAPPPWTGLTGYQLLGMSTLQHLAGGAQALDRALREPSDSLIVELGQRWATLLRAALNGSEVDRRARPQWSPAVWDHWRGIDRVVVGGGLAASLLGRRALRYADDALGGRPRVEVSPYAALLPLVGVARESPPDADCVPLVDFGQTAIKPAVAFLAAGTVVELELGPRIPAEFPDDPAVLARRMTQVIVQGVISASNFSDLSIPPSTTPVVVAIACYVIDGQPVVDTGYGSLRSITDDVPALLSQMAGARVGRGVQVRLMHDGTAAAAALAGATGTAVLTWGTALGIGFPPPANGLRPLAPSLRIRVHAASNG